MIRMRQAWPLAWVIAIAVVLSIGASEPTFGNLAFGMGDYPGGTLHAVWTIEGDEDEAPVDYMVDVIPNGDLFEMIETITSPSLEIDEVGSGFGPSRAAGTAGVQYSDDEDENIDTSPLTALDDRNIEVQPNENYYLPDGARLVAGNIVEYAGIEAVLCTYYHPSYSNQIVIIALASQATSDLLLFPIYMRTEKDGVVTRVIELIEFVYEP
jgi:hypothetical protein